jgi:diacylglycerol kinase (ATP)
MRTYQQPQFLESVKSCVIFNPSAGNPDASSDFRDHVEGSAGVQLFESHTPEEARALARRCSGRFDLVMAAGGDGTLNDVVNGLWEAGDGPPQPTVAIIPLGTGNDLARTLEIPDDPLLAFDLALKGARRKIDLIRVEHAGGLRIGVNVSAGGFAGDLNEHMTPELKKSWGPLAYLLGAARSLPDLSGYRVEIAWEGGAPEPIEAFNIVVANGRTAGGGKPAAPRANPEDGLLDVVVIRPGSAAELAGLAGLFVAGGNYLEHDLVLYRRAQRLRVEAWPGMWFNVDGELLTQEPISFSAVPAALEVVTGPAYVPDVPDE